MRARQHGLACLTGWLCIELSDLKFSGFNLNLIGFEPDRLEEILAGMRSSGLTDPDSVPEPPDHPVTRHGDIWLVGDHAVGGGDSTSAADIEPVLAGARPGLMVTDPPYGADYDPSRRAWRVGSRNLARGKVLNDDRADWQQAYALFTGDVAYVWLGTLHGDVVGADLVACGLQTRAQIVWSSSILR